MTTPLTGSVGRLDQRRHARVRVHFPARYVSPNLNIEGQVTDVSAEGLFFCSDYLDDQGETARVSVELPSGGQIELRGEVRWVNDRPQGGGMGIKLVDVTLEDRLRLQSLAAEGDAARAPATPSGNA